MRSQERKKGKSPAANASHMLLKGYNGKFSGPSHHETLVNSVVLQRLHRALDQAKNNFKNSSQSSILSHSKSIMDRPTSTIQHSIYLGSLLERATQYCQMDEGSLVERIDLRGASLNFSDFVTLCAVLSRHPTIFSIDLRGNKVPDQMTADALCDLLRANRSITQILLNLHEDINLARWEMMQSLLRANKKYSKRERRRKWVRQEEQIYDSSVNEFVAYLEEFFFTESRLRNDIGVMQEERWGELRQLASLNSQRKAEKQKARRMLEAIHERVLWLVERESKFRLSIVREWSLSTFVQLDALEVHARISFYAWEKRGRVELKTAEKQHWAVYKRKERVRKESEAAARLDVEEQESGERDTILVSCFQEMYNLEDEESVAREDALVAEYVRIEKERREALRKKAEEQGKRKVVTISLA